MQISLMTPLCEEPEDVVARVQERGLLRPTDVDGMYLLTPIGHALRDTILERWPALHRVLRARLLEHLQERLLLDADSPLSQALRDIDRAHFIPEPGRVLADLDMPAPTGIDEMTTSAPHAIVSLLLAVDPRPGDRVLICGGKGGVTAALAASLVGADGAVTVLDWSQRTVAHVRGAMGVYPELAPRVRVLHQDDVTLGKREGRGWDCIVLNGSVPKIPWPLVSQLSEDGRLLLFLQEPGRDGQTCYLLRKDREVVEEEELSSFAFTPIYGRYGWDRMDRLAQDWARQQHED